MLRILRNVSLRSPMHALLWRRMLLVLTAGPRDFAVKFEHKDAKESHLGSRCRGLGTLVTSCSWLCFNDWSASKSESEARGMDKESARGI